MVTLGMLFFNQPQPTLLVGMETEGKHSIDNSHSEISQLQRRPLSTDWNHVV